MKKELQMRLAVAKFMQDTLQEIAAKKKKDNNSNEGKDSSGAKEVSHIKKNCVLNSSLIINN
jgi:hypothetical protein